MSSIVNSIQVLWLWCCFILP